MNRADDEKHRGPEWICSRVPKCDLDGHICQITWPKMIRNASSDVAVTGPIAKLAASSREVLKYTS